MARSTVAVRFTGDVSNLQGSIGKADRSLGGLSGRIGKMSGRAKAAFAGLGLATVAFAKDSVDAYVESEQSQQALQDAFDRFPALADTNVDALRELNSELARKVKFDDDALASGQAVLAQFGITGKQLEGVTPLLADYAAKSGKDIPTASKIVGKALLGNTRALKDIGINYKSTGDKAKDFENIQGLLRKQVGGFAEKEGQTAAGKAAILRNQFGELQETVGSKLVPALTKLATIGLGIVAFIERLSPGVKTALAVLAGLIAVVYTVVKAVKAWTAVQAAFNVVMGANPIVLVILAIAALVAGVVIAYKRFEGFRKVVDSVGRFFSERLWPILKGVAGWFTGTLIPTVARIASTFAEVVGKVKAKLDEWVAKARAVVDAIIRTIARVVSWLRDLPGRIRRAASSVWEALKSGLKAAVDWIIGQIDRALGPLDEMLGKLSGLRSSAGVQKIADDLMAGKRAAGGPVMRGRTYLVGEKGPELFTAPTAGRIVPNHRLGGAAGGGQVVQVTFVNRGVIGSSTELERWLAQALNRLERKGVR